MYRFNNGFGITESSDELSEMPYYYSDDGGVSASDIVKNPAAAEPVPMPKPTGDVITTQSAQPQPSGFDLGEFLSGLISNPLTWIVVGLYFFGGDGKGRKFL